jgi:exodeoxyribonuclease VII large subunit
MAPAGAGALMAMLEKRKAALQAEGLFDPARKKPIPYLPRVIGVVTSPTGAVIRDILHRLADRFPSHVVLWPVLVQGQGAAEQVAAAVRGFSELREGGPVAPNGIARPDVLIVGRGGGSIEDLWAFNEEEVVRAIAECSIPVISAVGHETDTTLADFAADMRAPTPTAAAEMAVPVREDLLGFLGDLALRKRRAVMRPVTLGRERLAARAERLPAPQELVAAPAQALDEASERLRRGLGTCAQVAGMRLQNVSGRLSLPLLSARLDRARDRLAAQRLSPAQVTARLAGERQRLDAVTRVMASLNPDNVLKRGYVRVTGADGATLTTAAAAGKEAMLGLHFRDGVLSVFTGEAPPKAPAPKPKPAKLQQDDLFG